jgi:transcription-repair coupling factor (superfamily II helicase)
MEIQSNLQEILSLYQNQESVKIFTRQIAGSSISRVRLKGMSGSLNAIIISACIEALVRPFIIVLNDKEEAAFLYTDLCNILPSNTFFFFPSSYKRSIQYGQILADALIQRTDTLAAIPNLSSVDQPKTVIITYADALCEKIVTQHYFEKNTISISVSEKISQDFLTDFLLEIGFERVEFVYEPGQFSLRGSIVDVFSFTSAFPFRIDFFGNIVESIRSFDIDNQLSMDSFERAIIVPNLHTGKNESPLTQLTDQLPKNSIIWIRDLEWVVGRMNDVYAIMDNAESVTSGAKFFEAIQEFSTVEFGIKPLLKQNQTISFETTPQPAFRKNFDLLSQNLIEYLAKGYQPFILAENPLQHQRLQNIFESTNQDVRFTAIESTLHEGFIDHNLRICLYTDHQLFDRYHKYKLKNELTNRNSISIQELMSLKSGDFVVHVDHGVGVFGGLVKTNVNGKIQEAVRLTYKDGDTLFVNIHALHRISKFRGKDSELPKLYKLGSAAWQRLKQNTKRKVKDIAKELIALYAKRRTERGFGFSPDSYLQQELEASFIYEDTPDQITATQAVKDDMHANIPMDRLICGDVGFGKTEIAIRAAFKAVADSKQVAVLVPTTVLALQHFQTFSQRLASFPCNVDFLSRMKTAKNQKDTLKKLEEGKIDILIGTHAMLGNTVKFKNLGLIIVDEEQKFGVAAKEKLKKIRINVDTLTLTATPIPRTLQFSLMGARDLSIINTPPPNRHPISTEIHALNTEIIKEAIDYEVNRGGQVFFVHNRVKNIAEIQQMISKICPRVTSVVAHGQMEPSKLEKTMLDFISGDYDVLISTMIIESGLDIPNANTIIVNNAHMFGLSDLHQLRGRVGRSNKKAFCYLITPPLDVLTNEARRRLKAIEELSELGSGFSIAMQDLDIRGAGNLLGGEQSGFIAEIGFETYHKILDEAIQELKEEEFKDLFDNINEGKQTKWQPGSSDCYIETDMELLIPDSYVNSVPERMRLYRELDGLRGTTEPNKFKEKLRDRFGPIPEQVEDLLRIVQLREQAVNLGIEKLILKNDILIGQFITNQISPFYSSATFVNILNAIQKSPNRFQLKESKEKLSLVAKNVKKVTDAIDVLQLLESELR